MSAIDIQPFVFALKDESAYIRARAAEILGRLKNPEAVPALMEALFEPANTPKFDSGLFYQKSVQNLVTDALVEINGPSVVAEMEKLLDGDDHNWRVMAVMLLKIIAKRNKERHAIIRVLQRHLGDSDLSMRTHIIEALGEVIAVDSQ